MLVLEPDRCGPRHPNRHTPRREPGSVRRTSSIDTRWPDGLEHDMVVECRARDLLTAADGTSRVIDEVRFSLGLDAASRVVRLRSSDTHAAELSVLDGLRIGPGFRDHLAERASAIVGSGSAMHLLLDDLPGASLVSGYALLRGGLLGPADPDAFGERADICAGWARDGAMMQAIREHHTIPTPDGPPAPVLHADDDPLSWHDLPVLEPVATRRMRRIDVRPVAESADCTVEALFRDSHVGDRPETVLHEYEVTATVHEGTITSIAAHPNVLPWVECPGAVASAQGLVGTPAGVLRQHVRAEFKGTSTCTHLNDTLRHLADVDTLNTMLAEAI